MRFYLAALAIVLSSSAMAEWKYTESRDEMRDVVTKTASLESLPSADNGGGTLIVTAVQSGDKSGLSIAITQGNLGCAEQLCSVNMRFDSGRIIELKAIPADGRPNALYAQDPNLFVATAKLASQLIIEVPVIRGGRQQFKFELQGLSLDPVITKKGELVDGVAGFKWGNSLEPGDRFAPGRNPSGREKCFINTRSEKIAGQPVKSLTLCTLDDRLVKAIFETEKKPGKLIRKQIDKAIGKPETDYEGTWTNWSNQIDSSLIDASVLSGTTFVISYSPLENLEPPSQKK